MCFTSDSTSRADPEAVIPFRAVVESDDRSRPDTATTVLDEDKQRVARVYVEQQERYRSAVVSAVHDRGIRALCAAGRGCTDDAKCGFCPQGALRPQPLDGFEVYSPAVAQARSYWSVGSGDLPSHVLHQGVDAGVISLGAMLLAAHMQGHSCLTAAFDGVLPVSVPHDVLSLTGVRSWAKREKLKFTSEADSRLLLVCTIAVVSSHAEKITTQETVHCFQVSNEVWNTFPETQLPNFTTVNGDVTHTHKISMRAGTFAAFMRRPEFVVVDRGYVPPVVRECISCAVLPHEVKYCDVCHYVVVSDAHEARCAVPDMYAMETLSRRAQIGDTLHRLDVLCFLMKRGVLSSQRTIKLTEYAMGSAQASFMRLCGYAGPTAVLSTWFEAAYDYFRPYYLYVTFAEHPSWGSKQISTMLPGLDPSRYAPNVHPDYQHTWDHVYKISVNSEMPDDLVVLLYRRVLEGNEPQHALYLHQYSQL